VVLRHERQLTAPATVPDLHRRAAGWLLEGGFVSEAIAHTSAAGDAAEAGELIARHWFPWTQAGKRATAESWLDGLPDAVLRADARLCLARAWVSFTGGRLEDVLPWAEAAEHAGVPGPLWAGVTSPAADASTLRTSYYLLVGDLGRAQDVARLALDLEESPPWRAVAFNCLGTASYWLGGEGEAVELLQEAEQGARAVNPIVAIFALGHLALIEAEAADPDAAERFLADATHLIDSAGAAEYWVAACSRLARGRLLAGRGFLQEAAPELARGVELARRGAPRIVLAYGLLALAGVRRALAGRAALELVAEARRIVESCPDPGDRIRRLLDRAPTSAPRELPGAGEELTDRERAVLRLLATRLSQREIGRELDVSLNTIKSHARSIFRKLDAPGRREAVERARDAGLL
jgi:LuxR family maltose regulon positive regulatory protein